MANIKYFSECGGQAVQLTNICHRGDGRSAKNFDGTCPACGQRHTATRGIEYKAFASKHECDARCTGATGRTMRCECACGGKNHGRGAVGTVIHQISF